MISGGFKLFQALQKSGSDKFDLGGIRFQHQPVENESHKTQLWSVDKDRSKGRHFLSPLLRSPECSGWETRGVAQRGSSFVLFRFPNYLYCLLAGLLVPATSGHWLAVAEMILTLGQSGQAATSTCYPTWLYLELHPRQGRPLQCETPPCLCSALLGGGSWRWVWENETSGVRTFNYLGNEASKSEQVR